mgnify:CR=1 FL=1|tara:strand:+ start:388 stop:777 length:390 start_codon:yes stop_codon:yes gene_type:complete
MSRDLLVPLVPHTARSAASKQWVTDEISASSAGDACKPGAAKTVDYVALAADRCLTVDATAGNIQVTLLASASAEAALSLIRIDASARTVTVIVAGSETINGAASFTLLNGQWAEFKFTPLNGGGYSAG